MNTIWGFGCSFTDGVSINKLNKLPETQQDIDEHWLSELRKLFEKESKSYTTQNIGRGANSQRSTLYHLLSNSHKINSGDIVLIGHTTPDRDIYVLRGKEYGAPNGRISTLPVVGTTLDELERFLSPFADEADRKELGEVIRRHYVTLSSSKYNLLKEESDLVEYLLYNTGKLLKEKGVEVYHWGPELWFINYSGANYFPKKDLNYDYRDCIFENVRTWTNDKYIDVHWSPNGNKKAAQFFKYCIDNNYETFTLEALQEFLDLNNTPNFINKKLI